jgi:hypothetical protein
VELNVEQSGADESVEVERGERPPHARALRRGVAIDGDAGPGNDLVQPPTHRLGERRDGVQVPRPRG